MLRVSSLGLKRYNDTSRYLSLHFRRLSSKSAYQESDSGDSITIPNAEDDHRGDVLHSAQPGSSNVELSASIAMPEGRRRAIIPPLKFKKKKDRKADMDEHSVEATFTATSYADHGCTASSSDSGLSDALIDSSESLEEEFRGPRNGTVDAAMQALAYDHVDEAREILENIMDTTEAAEDAWDAYQRLVALPRPSVTPPSHYARLHRLARFISSTRPRTRPLFLRLLSVLSVLHSTGGQVHRWEWNALIDCAGKGWRKTRPEDLQTALDVYNDMVTRKAPGATFNGTRDSPSLQAPPIEGHQVVQPDIVTYTTLVNIAGRTLNHAVLRHAMGILGASGLPHNRVTHLALIRYFTRKNDLLGVRASLLKMKEQGLPLGLDGMNSCVWAYARNGRIDVAALIYRIMRHNLVPEDEVGRHDLHATIRVLAATEGLVVPDSIKPNAITYYTLIQCYAYHGDLVQSIQVFMDMMLANDEADFLHKDFKPDSSGADNSPTLPAFRAIFLGFARHGKATEHLKGAGPITLRLMSSAWTMVHLEALFNSFMQLPHDVNPSDRTIYWILTAFDTLTGHADWKLRRIWEKLEERFGARWGGRLERFRKRIYESDSEQNE